MNVSSLLILLANQILFPCHAEQAALSPSYSQGLLLSSPCSSVIKTWFPMKGWEWNQKFPPWSTHWYPAAALQPAKEKKRKLQARHWEITVRCLSLHNCLLQARVTSHCQVREDVPWRLDLIEMQFVSWISKIGCGWPTTLCPEGALKLVQDAQFHI